MDKPICNYQLSREPNALNMNLLKLILEEAFAAAKCCRGLKDQIWQRVSFFHGETWRKKAYYTSDQEYPIISLTSILYFSNMIQ